MGGYLWSNGLSSSSLGLSWGASSVISATRCEWEWLGSSLTCSVLAQVTATIVKPREDRPYEGYLQITSEISPMASSVFEAGR